MRDAIIPWPAAHRVVRLGPTSLRDGQTGNPRPHLHPQQPHRRRRWRIETPPDPVLAAGAAAIARLGERYGFEVEQADRTAFTDEQLARYSAVVFVYTQGTALLTDQKQAFQRYIRGGGGFVGVHLLDAGESLWPWFGDLLGADFRRELGRPENLVILRADSTHLSMRGVPAVWTLKATWSEFERLRPAVRVLATLDPGQRRKLESWSDHEAPLPSYPVAWYHDFEGGRAWYTVLGGDPSVYSDPAFLNHLAGGILWAAGN